MTDISEYQIGKNIGEKLVKFSPISDDLLYARTTKQSENDEVINDFFSCAQNQKLILVVLTQSLPEKEFLFIPVFDLEDFMLGLIQGKTEEDDLLQFFPHRPLTVLDEKLFFVPNNIIDIPLITYNFPSLIQRKSYGFATTTGIGEIPVPVIDIHDQNEL